jgi:hypothetical protein
VATQHKLSTSASLFVLSRSHRGVSRLGKDHLAHLRCMDTPRERTGESRHEDSLDPILTMSQLAARLHVNVQALYDLRSQGRVHAVSGLDARSGSASARLRRGSRAWKAPMASTRPRAVTDEGPAED